LRRQQGRGPAAWRPAAAQPWPHRGNRRIRPPRWIEIGLQSLVTALCGLVSTPVWLALTGSPGGNFDFVALVTLFGAVMSLAWYLPRAAEAGLYDPLTKAREARLEILLTAALKQFGSEESAGRWMAQPCRALGNRTPKEAASDIELFPQLLGILQQQPGQTKSNELTKLEKSPDHSVQPLDGPVDHTFSDDGRNAAVQFEGATA
jgi:Protein of unknown function (DUF2384)